MFVEDTNDEAFYRALLKSAARNEVKVERVFALNGRDNVITAAKNYNQQTRSALFIIDGDLSWVKGETAPQVIGLHCHDAYCIENLILCEKALTLILSQEAAITEEEAMVLLAYEQWIESIQTPLLELFSAFATAYDLAVPKENRAIGCANDRRRIVRVIRLHNINSESFSFPGSAWG